MANEFKFEPLDGLRDRSIYPTNPGSEDAAREQVQRGMDQLKNFINSDVVVMKETVSFVATLYQANELVGAYTRLKFLVNKNITVNFPMVSNSFRIQDNGNGLRELIYESFDASNTSYNYLSFLVNGGDVRSVFTNGRVYTIL